MNTVLNVMGIVAALWLAVYSFGTLAQDALGWLGIGFFLYFIPGTIIAFLDDWEAFKTKTRRGGEG